MQMRNRLLLIALLALLTSWVMAQPVVITPPSATIEPGESVTLTASGAMYYQWSPATGLSTTEGSVTVASPMTTTTYTCTGLGPGAESVVNGDFEQGNVGFTSAYEQNSNLWNEGTYYVDFDASLHHTSFVGLGHGGTGNFMMVNGSTSPGTNVWTEQISVQPNQTYAFSTWVCTLAGQASEAALLQFSINGNQIGEVFSAPPYTNTWQQFYQLWNSGNSTTATITILNQNTVGSGNDFGLDDISFCQLVVLGAPQCTVTVNSMNASATADDTELCEGGSTTLHALPTGGSGNYSYSWTPAGSLNNANIQHPTATPPVGTTTYACRITDNSWGSSQNVSVSVTVHPNEEVQLHETICPGDTYDFYGEQIGESGLYEHHLQTQYGCDKAVFLNLDHWPTYDEATITASICDGEVYNFYGTNYDHSCQASHTLVTGHGCDSIIRLNLNVYPPNDTLVVDASICVGQTFNFHGMLFNQDGQVAYFDTVDNHGCLKVERLELSVGAYQVPPVLYQYECFSHGTTPGWTWDKTGITYHEDTYEEVILDDPEGGCPIKHRLDLKFHEEYLHEETKVACDSYCWPVNGITYTTSQDRVEAVFHHDFGDKVCDSVYVLHLEISNYETNEFAVPYEESCDSYLWDPKGHEFTTEDNIVPEDNVYTTTGTYHRTYKNLMGCDSIVTMHVDFDYTPSPTPIYPVDPNNTAPHWVVTASEFQINQYDFYLWDTNPNCSWDTVVWSFKEPIEWILEPFGQNGKCCKVLVLNQVEDTVWLTARAFNRCTPYEGVERRYWMVCSYYGLDESIRPDFSVSPNPNNGQMELYFEHLTGRIDVKVYDMKGNMIDDFQIDNDMDRKTIQYHLGQCSGGVYSFVATGKEGAVSKKVVVVR